jgi:hypothetical protein
LKKPLYLCEKQLGHEPFSYGSIVKDDQFYDRKVNARGLLKHLQEETIWSLRTKAVWQNIVGV